MARKSAELNTTEWEPSPVQVHSMRKESRLVVNKIITKLVSSKMQETSLLMPIGSPQTTFSEKRSSKLPYCQQADGPAETDSFGE